MKKLISLLSFVSCLFSFAKAQDTLQVMQYNLLQYGVSYGGCDDSNNDYLDKEAYLRTIIGEVQPDILTVNELGENIAYHDRLLNYVMNSDGRTWYSRGARSNYAGSSIVNNIYYDNRKLTLFQQIPFAVGNGLRDINLYKFFYNSPDLSSGGDTVWLTCISMHLAAGFEDTLDRITMVSVVMNYLDALNQPGNYLAMGDFNVYSGDEGCFQTLINHSNTNIRFNDPINKIGDWNNNSYFAPYHTQSTHSDDNGCAASGGMDDRFDYILASNYIISGGQRVKYVSSSYNALGNDGNHFNKSINYGTNSSVSASVLNALYNNSDHLPVLLKLAITTTTGINDPVIVPFDFYIPANSADDNGILVSPCSGRYSIDVMNVTGSLICRFQSEASTGYNTINLSVVPKTASIAFFRITDPDGNVKVYRTLR